MLHPTLDKPLHLPAAFFGDLRHAEWDAHSLITRMWPPAEVKAHNQQRTQAAAAGRVSHEALTREGSRCRSSATVDTRLAYLEDGAAADTDDAFDDSRTGGRKSLALGTAMPFIHLLNCVLRG
jgi:hypothetical protein